MGLSLRILPGVPRYIERELREISRLFPTISEVKDRVRVTVVPAPALRSPDDEYGFGVFLRPAHTKFSGRLDIYVAGKPEDYKRRGFTTKDMIRFVGETLLHELAHYEQWRDHRRITERGVDVRARGLYRQIDKAR